MPRLYRPHIPLSVRCAVAERQLSAYRKLDDLIVASFAAELKYGERLEYILKALAMRLGCEVSELRLDHDPPLGARPLMHKRKTGTIVYKPDANDPDDLFYRPHGPQHSGSHLIKTLIRGDNGQFPDRVLIKRAKRLANPPKPKPKKKWPSRPFPKRSKK